VYIGVDVGATYIRVGMVGSDGVVLRKVKSRQPVTGDEYAVARRIVNMISELAPGELIGVGVGSIGPLDLGRGIVVNAPNAPIRRFHIVKPIIEALGVPVVLANDAMAAAWGEYVFGSGRGFENLVYVTFSTGIGAGVIVDGNLLVGKDGNAHEVGHMVITTEEIKCGCGGIGHWEAIAGGANLGRSLARFLESRGMGKLTVDPELIFARYREGDPVFKEYVDYIMRINSAGLASLINAYDPELVIIGGSVALNNREIFQEGFRRYLGQYLAVREPMIRFTEFGEDVGLIGAAALVKETPNSLLRFIRGYSSMVS
jgi:glucokinase